MSDGPTLDGANLLRCPFCDGKADLTKSRVRSGYGEYERGLIYHHCECRKCGARGRSYEEKALIDFTTYTVGDFRSNPILRAKVEDDYEAYCKQTKEMAVDAWNARAKPRP